MSQIATTKMSSKGQIVIPEIVREQLGLESGSQFIVMAEKDVIILKIITPPSMTDFSKLLAKTHKAVKEAGITPKDLEDAIKEVRKENKNRT